MRLADAAKRFDKLTCSDAYNPSTQFVGQLDVFDDSKRDGTTVERRILSLAPDVSIPARRAISFDSQHWIVGEQAPDYFNGLAIRRKYVVQRASGLATIKSIAEAIAGSAGVTAYAGKVWIKASKEVEVSSNVTEVYSVFFANTETIGEGDLVVLDGATLLVRGSHDSAAGFLVADTDQLDGAAVVTGSLMSATHNPVTDTKSTTSQSLQLVRIRWQSHFDYLTEGSEDYLRGDLVACMAADVSVKAGDTLVLADGAWRVMSVIDKGTYLLTHLRRG